MARSAHAKTRRQTAHLRLTFNERPGSYELRWAGLSPAARVEWAGVDLSLPALGFPDRPPDRVDVAGCRHRDVDWDEAFRVELPDADDGYWGTACALHRTGILSTVLVTAPPDGGYRLRYLWAETDGTLDDTVLVSTAAQLVARLADMATLWDAFGFEPPLLAR